MQTAKTNILVVEDNRAHAKLVLLGLNKHDSVFAEHVSDGAAALDYLHREQPFADRPMTDIVLLDLKLPKVDGFEVLAAVKGDPSLRHIPVIILSTSCSEEDRRKAYALHANSYLAKPLDFAQFEQMIADMKLYWCQWNLPAIEKAGAGGAERV